MAKRPHLYWTPCAAHCFHLILEDGNANFTNLCMQPDIF